MLMPTHSLLLQLHPIFYCFRDITIYWSTIYVCRRCFTRAPQSCLKPLDHSGCRLLWKLV